MNNGCRGTEKHFGLTYQTRLLQNDEREYGDLCSIDLASDDLKMNFPNIDTLMKFFESGKLEKVNCYVVVDDLDVFVSYLYMDFLKDKGNFISEYKTGTTKQLTNSNAEYDWRWCYGAHLYFLQIKLKSSVITFIDIKTKTKSFKSDAKSIYSVAETLETNGFKNLFYGLNGSFNIEHYAIKKFLEVGPNEDPSKNVRSWKNCHPSELSKEDTRLRQIFIEEQSSDLSKAYKPAVRAVAGRKHVIKYDCNNMYPWILTTFRFPRGYGKHFDGSIELDKKPNSTALYLHVEIQNGYRTCTEDLETKSEALDTTTWIWDFELEEMIRVHQGMRYNIIEYYQFGTAPISKEQIEYLKSNYKKYRETGNKMYKQLNNVIYGKFSQRDIKSKKIPIVDKKGRFTTESVEEESSTIPSHQYYPMGSTIVARGRYIISQIVHNDAIDIEDVAYIDTDSVAFVKNERVLKYLASVPFVEGKEFGQWKLELDNIFNIYGLKDYYGVGIEKIIEAHCGGGKYSEAEYFDEMTGESITSMLVTNRRTDGGYVKVPKTIHTKARGENNE